MVGVGEDEEDGGDVDDEDDAEGGYLGPPLDVAQADSLVPV